MGEAISRALAEAALAAIREQFKAHLQPFDWGEGRVDPAPEGPELVEDFRGEGHWAICWESGPDEWALRAFHGGVDPEIFEEMFDELRGQGVPELEARARARKVAQDSAVACPDGVYTEPYMSFILALFPAE